MLVRRPRCRPAPLIVRFKVDDWAMQWRLSSAALLVGVPGVWRMRSRPYGQRWVCDFPPLPLAA